MSTPTTVRIARTIRAAALLGVVVSALTVAGPTGPAAAQVAPATPPVIEARVTDAGLEPSTITARAGQSVRIRNQASETITIAADDGTFDSGDVAPGGAFVFAVTGTDRVPFAISGATDARGLVVLALDRLPGADTANARAAIPRLDPAPVGEQDFSPHPDYGLPTSRTRLLVLPTATATVGQVNAALAGAGALITSGFDVLDTFGVSIPDAGDFSTLVPAMDAFRTAPGIAAVAPVWAGDTERVTEPSDLVDDPADDSTTWNLADIRAYEAWNFLDAARDRSSARPDVVVLDVGFDTAHPDLAFASSDVGPVDDHGTHVAGIIGARFANPSPAKGRTLGVNGVDPLARLHAVPLVNSGVVQAGDPSYQSSISALVDYASAFNRTLASGAYANLRVINASFGAAVYGPSSAQDFTLATANRCGPDLKGDGEPARCTPETHELFQRDLAAVAQAYAERVLLVAMQRNAVIVKSAGNGNDEFCAAKSAATVPQRAACRRLAAANRDDYDAIDLPAVATNEFLLARQLMGGSAPVVVVGARDASGLPASFSQPGADVSAPGVAVVSTISTPSGNVAPAAGQYTAADGSWYEALDGTSMAAPHVTGAISLLQQVASNLGWSQVVNLVRTTARAAGAGPPQLDAYALVTAAVGVTPLVDVNDTSLDGSERFVLDDRNRPYQSAGVPVSDALGQRAAAPDREVDLRDFRRFRDAWLQMCSERDASDPCTPGLVVALDGYVDNPAKDANSDDCVTDPARSAPCLRSEAERSRFDYNGSGLLDADPAAVPIDPSSGFGRVANPPLLSDLDVFRAAVRSNGTSTIEGWPRAEVKNSDLLEQLLVSGDLHVRLDQAFPTATSAEINVDYGSGTLTHTIRRTSAQGLRSVVTVPVDPAGSPVRVWATADGGDTVATSVVQVDELRPGQDVAVTPCRARLAVTADRTTLLTNQSSELYAHVDECPLPPAGQSDWAEVAFEVTSNEPGAPFLLLDVVPIEADGIARNTLTAGNTPGTYPVRWVSRLPDGTEVAGADLTVTVVSDIRVDYVWRSTLKDYEESGSTRWPSATPAFPDCAGVGGTCIDEYHAGPAPGVPAWSAERRGSLRLTADGVTLTEEIVGGDGSTQVDYTWSRPDGASGTATKRYDFGLLFGERTRYANEPMPGMDLTVEGDVVRLDGLERLTLLGYRSRLEPTVSPPSAPDPGVLTVPADLFLKPDEVGDAAAWPGFPTLEVCVGAIELDGERITDGDCPRPEFQVCVGSIELEGETVASPPCRPPSGPVYFETAPTGGFEPRQRCKVKTRSLDVGPGYRVQAPDEWIPGASSLERDPSYDPGDVPLPEATGSISFLSRFAATVTIDGSEPPEPELPDCGGSAPPTAAFELLLPSDGTLEEGDLLRLDDRSSDTDGDIVSWAWTFGDGRTSTVSDPVVDGYENNGTYTITLTVTDAGGATASASRTVTVVNAAPTIIAVPPVVVVPPGGVMKFSAVLYDQGATDARRLTYRTGSIGYGLPSPQLVVTRGYHTLTVGGVLPPGQYQIPLQVTDPDGATAITWVTVVVLSTAGVPFPTPVPPTAVTVAGSAPTNLEGWEADLADHLVESRQATSAGVPTLSAALTTTAAELARAELDGGTVDLEARAAANGYNGAGGRLGAVTLDGGVDPAVALAGVTGIARAALFGPGWEMMGIARVSDGSRVAVVVVLGDVLDLDDPPALQGTAPTVEVTAPATTIEGTNVTLALAVTDPDDDVADISVDWGDGVRDGTTHRFLDDGIYRVTVSVLDEQGNTGSKTITIAVTNAAPEVELVAQDPLVVGEPGSVTAIVVDRGERDRPLRLDLRSTSPDLPESTTSVAGPRIFSFEPSTPGQFTVDATVTDTDGATTSTQLTIDVLAASPPVSPPPANVSVSAPSCSAGIPVQAQAADYLVESNGYRASQGLAPLAVDPKLTVAAERHLADMIAGTFMAHYGSDGSTPLARARAAGYTTSIGENLVKAAVTPRDALGAWRMSPPHHANLLDSHWRATGIAVGNSPIGVLWVQLFGDELTCPPPTPPAPTPELLANPADVLRGVLAFPDRSEVAAPLPAGVSVPRAAMPADVVVQQATPAPTGTVAAFTVSDDEPLTGEPVTIVNRSRHRGQPVDGTINLPGGGTRTLAADASFTARFVSAGPAELSMRITTAADSITARSALAVSGEALVPNVALSAPAEAAQGEPLAAVVTVTDVNGDPVGGRTVRVGLVAAATVTATAVTDADGTAAVPLRMDVPTAGTWQVRAAVLDDAGDPVAESNVVDVTVTTNLPAVADAGGPYLVNLGDSVTLDATDSYDPGVGGAVTTVTWDLDGDGLYGDVAGSTIEVPWPLLERVLCRGTCAADRDYPVGVQVVDEAGATSQAATTLRFERDYGLFVTPEIHTIVPGGSNQFTVSAVTTSGFDEEIDLTAPGLPTGVSATFNPARVRVGQQSAMTVTLASTVQGVESIDLTVRGVSRATGVVREASPTVSVVFGLLPVCTATLRGRVLDTETGLPVADARVTVGARVVTTDAAGRWEATGLALGANNNPLQYGIQATRDGYWSGTAFRQAICGTTGEVDISIVPVKSVPVRIQVREGEPDPRRPGKLVITDGIPAGAVLRPDGQFTAAVPLQPGGYADIAVPLAFNNADRVLSFPWADAPGYWDNRVQDPPTLTLAQVGGPRVSAVIPLVRRCSVDLVGGVVRDPKGAPAPGAKVQSGSLVAVADASGRYRFDAEIPMTSGNNPVYISVYATPPTGMAALPGSAALYGQTCDERLFVDVWLTAPTTPPPPPPQAATTVRGTVTDEITGAALAGVSVNAAGRATTTAADGTYTVTFDMTAGTTVTQNVYAWKDGYWSRSTPVPVTAGQTMTVDVALTPVRTGAAEVVVRDLATGLPLAGATVWVGGTARTSGADGRVRFDAVSLSTGNTPAIATASASAATYWQRSVQFEARAGETAFVDLGLLRECQPADVRGLVLDAVTREPLAGASVTGPGAGTTTTASNGTFALNDIRLQSQNTPWKISLTASKPGYLSQTKSVLVFCGARIQVDYGPQPIDPGVIEGVVTRSDTGVPVPGVIVGTDFGGSATTAADGSYRITGAPTQLDGSPERWGVTAQAPFERFLHPASTTVTVEAGTTTRADLALDAMAPPNRFPVAAVVNPVTGPEGSPIQLDATGSTDPDNDALTFDWDLDADGAYDDATGATPSVTLAVAGSRTVRVKVTDDKLLTATAPVTVVATNVAPVLDAGSDAVVTVGSTVTRTVTFSDPGADSWTVERRWSDEPAVEAGLTERSFGVTRTFGSPGTFTFEANVRDTHGGQSTDSFTVTVEGVPANGAPTARITGPATVDEGQRATYSGEGSTDPESGPLGFAWDIDGDGFDDGSEPTVELPAGPPGSRTVAVQVTDDEGQSHIASVGVEVLNVAPTLDAIIPSAASPEIETTVTLAASDPGTGPLAATVDWGDGPGPAPVPVTLLAVDAPSGVAVEGAAARAYPAAGSYVVEVRVCDPHGACTIRSATIVVSEPPVGNRPPQAVITGESTTDEGRSVTLSATGSNDPDGDAVTYAWSIDGEPAGAGDTVEVPAPRPGVRTVTLTVSDPDAASSATSVTVTVANWSPILELTGPLGAVAPDDPVTLAVRATDAGDQPLTATIDTGTGPSELVLTPVAAASGVAFDASPVASFALPGDHPVTVEVCDDSGACASSTVVVSVEGAPPPPNHPPVAAISGPTTIDEGTEVALSGEGSSDPDGDRLTHRWRVDGVEAGTGPVLTLPGRAHGVLDVALTVDDGRGATSTTAVTIVVRNMPPAMQAVAAAAIDAGLVWSLEIDAVEPWARAITTRVEWGDGAVSDLDLAAGSPGQWSAMVTHIYGTPGNYTVTLTACDEVGACAQSTRHVTVSSPIEPSGPIDPPTDPLPPTDPPASGPATPDAVRPSVPSVPVTTELPATGASHGPHVELAALLLVLGTLVRLLARRRRGQPALPD